MLSKSVKFFPFSPGIPWQIKNGKYVLPEVPANHLSNLIDGKTITVLNFGGLLEAFFSLFFLETFKTLKAKQDLEWVGSEKFQPLIEANCIAKYSEVVDKSVLSRFPTPIFFDKENRVYINSLYNYLDVYSYYLEYCYSDTKSGADQILKNIIYPSTYWENPKLRKLEISDSLRFHLNSVKLDLSLPFMLVLPDTTNDSMHDCVCLDWNTRDLNAMATMLYPQQIQLVVLTPYVGKYFGGRAKVIPYSLEFALVLLSKATAILSRDIDFIYLARALFSNISFSLPISGPWAWAKNQHMVREENVIYVEKEITPTSVLNYLKDL